MALEVSISSSDKIEAQLISFANQATNMNGSEGVYFKKRYD